MDKPEPFHPYSQSLQKDCSHSPFCSGPRSPHVCTCDRKGPGQDHSREEKYVSCAVSRSRRWLISYLVISKRLLYLFAGCKETHVEKCSDGDSRYRVPSKLTHYLKWKDEEVEPDASEFMMLSSLIVSLRRKIHTYWRMCAKYTLLLDISSEEHGTCEMSAAYKGSGVVRIRSNAIYDNFRSMALYIT